MQLELIIVLSVIKIIIKLKKNWSWQ